MGRRYQAARLDRHEFVTPLCRRPDHQRLGRALAGRDPFDIVALERPFLPSQLFNHSVIDFATRGAWGGVEVALWGLRGKLRGSTRYQTAGRHSAPEDSVYRLFLPSPSGREFRRRGAYRRGGGLLPVQSFVRSVVDVWRSGLDCFAIAAQFVSDRNAGTPYWVAKRRKNRIAAFARRCRCTRISGTFPLASTTRQSQTCWPLVLMPTSSMCHLSRGCGRSRRMQSAKMLPQPVCPLPGRQKRLVQPEDPRRPPYSGRAQIDLNGMRDDRSRKTGAFQAG